MNKQERLIAGFRDLYSRMAFLNRMKLEVHLKGYKPSEVHCLDFVGKNADCNVTKLADAFFMTRGAISKITKKLLQKGAIESYQRPDNRKEIFFRLTEQGEAVYQTHAQLHSEFQKRDKAVFDRLTAEQMETLLSFVESYSRHLDEEIAAQTDEP